MPFIDIKVIQGVFTLEEKRELVERVSEAAIRVEGEALRPYTVTALTETPERGVGGRWTDPCYRRRQGRAIGLRGCVGTG